MFSARIGILCGLAAIGLAAGLVVERRTGLRIERENGVLRDQLKHLDELTAENRRLADLLVQATQASGLTANSTPAAAHAPAEELHGLRDQVKQLRQQSQELETLRADTRLTRAALDGKGKSPRAGPASQGGAGSSTQGSQLELVRAEYWTDNARMDVTGELQERIRGDSLKAMASNSIKGDPEFGQVKHLTIEYRFGGVTRTNEFREGDVVVLPAE